jgi:predicted sugar kinase
MLERNYWKISTDTIFAKDIKAVDKVKKSEQAEADIVEIYQKVQGPKPQGKNEEVQKIVDGLSDEEWEVYKKLKEVFKQLSRVKFRVVRLWPLWVGLFTIVIRPN